MASIRGRVVGVVAWSWHRVMKLARRGRWPLTVGVRIVVRDADECVLLVKHTYAPGWHFPGGAIDPRETAADAAMRELREEALIECVGTPHLHGVFFNLTENKSDHIVVFETRSWKRVAGQMRTLEIADARFFPVSDLPEGTTGGTMRRLAELKGDAQPGTIW